MCVRFVYCMVGLCNVWQGPTSQCMYDWSRFTVPISQHVYDWCLRTVMCVKIVM